MEPPSRKLNLCHGPDGREDDGADDSGGGGGQVRHGRQNYAVLPAETRAAHGAGTQETAMESVGARVDWVECTLNKGSCDIL